MLQATAQGLVLRNKHAACSEAVLQGAVGGCSQDEAVKLPCCRQLFLHMLHSTMMLMLSCYGISWLWLLCCRELLHPGV